MLAVCCQRREHFRAPLLSFQSLTAKPFPACPHPSILLHHSPATGTEGRYARRLSRSGCRHRQAWFWQTTFRKGVPQLPAAGRADPVGVVKRLSPMDRHSGQTRRGPADARLSTTLNSHPHLPGCRFSRRRETVAATFVYLKRFGYLNRAAETLQILRACGCTSLLTWSKPLSIF